MIEKLWHWAKYRNLPGLANVISASRGCASRGSLFQSEDESEGGESAGHESFIDGHKELVSGRLQALSGLIVADCIGDVI